MDMKPKQPKHRARDIVIVAHPLPVRKSRYRTVLEAARAAAQPRTTPRLTLLDFLKKGSQQ